MNCDSKCVNIVLLQTGQVVLGDESVFSHHNYCMLAGLNMATKSVDLNLAICFEDEVEQEIEPHPVPLDRIILPICAYSFGYSNLIFNVNLSILFSFLLRYASVRFVYNCHSDCLWMHPKDSTFE